jgi:hypothetical protein
MEKTVTEQNKKISNLLTLNGEMLEKINTSTGAQEKLQNKVAGMF